MHRAQALAAALLCALAACAGAQASRYLQVGVVDDALLLYGNAPTAIAEYRTLHAQVLPVILYWGGGLGVASAKPRTPGNPADPAYHWGRYDALVREANAAGLQVVFTILDTPSWANGGQAANVAPTDPAALRAFADAAARRYSGHDVVDGAPLPAVRAWIAWNEPNNPVFLRPQYRRVAGTWVIESAVEYAKICNAIYAGIHGAGIGGERVACGATAPRGNNNPSSGRPSVSPLAFLRAVKRYGLRTFDAWAHHPYPARPSETPAESDGSGEAVELGNIGTLISLVTRLYGDKRIWVTEYAYETNPPDPYFGVPWKTQARYLTQAFAIARANPRIDMMLWFMLRDDTNPNGWQSGLLTSRGEKKPSFAAFREMAAGLAAADPHS